MAKEKELFRDSIVAQPEAADTKRQRLMNVAAVLVALLLALFLSPKYKVIGPLLPLAPLIISAVIIVLKKLRQAGELPLNPQGDQGYSHSAADRNRPVEPYACTHEDPKDPRRYKPIG